MFKRFLTGACAASLLLGGYYVAYAEPVAAQQQQATCTGIVVDETGEPLMGANVKVDGTDKGTVTDLDGHFKLPNVAVGSSLTVSYVGYSPQTVKWNGQEIVITLQENSNLLSEVVVVGYGVQKKVNLTGAVAAVNGDQINNRPVTNVGQALQGVIGNLKVTPNSGAPGQGASFNVRGVTSLSDGGATESGPLVLVDNVQMDINLVNPDDIEQISVLKDGASAAIYGARAAYGVILITTKKGKAGEKPQINFSATGYWSRAALEYHKLSSLDYINLYDEASTNQGGSPKFTGVAREMIEDYYYGRRDDPTYISPGDTSGKYSYCGNTDWWDELYKTAFNQNYNVSISGGTDKTTYYVSLGLFDQGTNRVGANEDYKRWNARINVSTQLTSWLNVGANISNSYISQKHPTGSANSGVTSMGGMLKNDLSPLMPVRHMNGDYAGQGSYTNPIAMAELGGTSKYKYNDLWLTGIVKITPIENLMIQADYTWNFYNTNNRIHSTEFMEYGVPGGYAAIYPWSKPTKVQYSTNNDYYTSFNVFGQYNLTLNEAHNFSLMVGYNQERKINGGFWAQRNDMITNDLYMLSQGTGQLTAGNNSTTQWAINSVFGRFNYDYLGKYLFEFTGRYDGTSKFPKGDRYGFFPSASLGWRVSEENFWGSIRDWWNNFKIRASFGRLGNQNVSSNFPYLLSYGINTNYNYIINDGTITAVTPPGIVSASLTWEKVNQFDLGFDAAFLNNRLVADFDWFSRETQDALVAGTPLPNTLGTSVPQANIASIRTNGWELSLNWNDRVQSIGLGYYVRLTLSDNWSTVTKYDNPSPDDPNLSYLYVGKRIGEIWGYTCNGLFQSQEEIDNHASQARFYGGVWQVGDVKYEDLDGNGVINNGNYTLNDHGDIKVIGNTQPRYMYGITAGAEWKGIDLEMFWQGVGKQDIWGGSVGDFWSFPNQWQSPLNHALDRWTEDNRDAYFPRLYLNQNGRNQYTSTRYLLNRSYVRLKNLTVGYTIPANITRVAGIQKCRIFLQGENLVTFSSMKKYGDPETPGKTTYPIQKKYSIGINLTL